METPDKWEKALTRDWEYGRIHLSVRGRTMILYLSKKRCKELIKWMRYN